MVFLSNEVNNTFNFSHVGGMCDETKSWKISKELLLFLRSFSHPTKSSVSPLPHSLVRSFGPIVIPGPWEEESQIRIF
jgi:hypothetical protein